MKLCLIVLLAVATVAVYSLPLENEYQPLEELLDDAALDGERGDRHRRVTCDLLSASAKGVSVNHAACAANCLSMGKAGGSCNNGVCQCRKTTFKDLWDKRFG